ncbi:LSU ribosomal protein L12AE [Candidatus Nanobsidianus stetteri]|uniref:LSU ribosomal protein L12AE n=1 Tax=Nanobsidianus stetteri TaxID=1294122 RepID=R1E4V9_NANST|nr:LSU ribosomal protein L12AE [Candidatus Nanobsidianus stetteri]
MGLEYIYAVWLLHEAKKEINADNIKKVLTSVGIEPNDAMVNAVLASLQGVDLDKIKEESLSVAPAQVAPQQVEQKKEEKQEKKEEEKKEEQALEGLSSLFGF